MNISFLNPSFLFGLPLAGIPILIHFLTQKKFKNLAFSETRFIRLALEKTVRRHRLRQYFLLFLRCLVILILTFLFARPVVQFGGVLGKTSEAEKYIVFLFDNSYSLGYLENGEERFTLTKKVGKEIVSAVDESWRAMVCAFSDRVNILTRGFIAEKKDWLEATDKIPLSNFPTDLSPVLGETYRLLHDLRGKDKTIVIISDFARNGWRNANPAPERYRVDPKKIDFYDPEVRICLIDVTGNEGRNCAVEEISARELSLNEPALLEAVVANYSPEKLSRFPIYLYTWQEKRGEERPGSDLPVRQGSGFLEIAKYERKSKQFLSEAHLGYVELSKDNLSLDDRRYFIFPHLGEVNVLAFDGSPGVFPVESELYYFRLALNPKREKSLIVLETLKNETELANLELNPEKYPLLVLANVEEMPQVEIGRIRNYLGDGGNLLITLGDKVEPSFYNENLDFLPANLLKPKKNSTHIVRLNATYPALKVFSPPAEADFSTVVFSSYYVLEAKQSSNVLIELSDGQPLLLENTPYSGGGKVFLFASTLDRDWTNLPLKPVYPVLFQELIRYLASKKKEIFSFTPDGNIRIPLAVKPEDFRVDSSQLIVKSLRIEWKEEDNFRGYELSPPAGGAISPGIYPFSYRIAGRRVGGYLLVNLNTAGGESDLRPISYLEIKSIFPRSFFTYLSVKQKYRDRFVQFLKGKEITQNLAIATFFLLVLEGLVANRFFPIKRVKKI